MGIVLLILKIAGIVLLCILGLVLLLLIVPVGVDVEYARQLSVKARVLCFRFALYPPHKKKKPTETEQPEKAPAEKKKVTPQQITDMLSPLSAAARWLLGKIHVSGVRVVWPVSAGDAAQTGIAFGRAHAAGGALLAFLQNIFIIDVEQYEIIPDFQDEYSDKRLIAFSLHSILLVLLCAGIVFLTRYSSVQNSAKKETTDESGQKLSR